MQLTSSIKGTPFWQHKQKSSVNQTVIFSRMIYDSFWKPIGLLLQWDAMAGRLNSLRWFPGFALRTSTADLDCLITFKAITSYGFVIVWRNFSGIPMTFLMSSSTVKFPWFLVSCLVVEPLLVSPITCKKS